MVPALISAVGTLGAAGLSAMSQSDANAQNYQMFKESQRYDWKKFTAEQRYNSIQNQVRQMRAAGLNPAVTQGMQSSVAAGGSPTSNPMQPVDYSPFLSGAASLSSSLYQGQVQEKQAANLEADTQGKIINNQTQGILNLRTIENLMANTKNLGWNSKYMEQLRDNFILQNEYLQRSMGDRLSTAQWQNEYERALASTQLIALKYADREHQSALNQSAAKIFADYASGRSSLQQAHNELMKVEAMFGKSEEDRKQFWKASLDALLQSRETSESEEYKNLHYPFSYSMGSDLFGHISHNTVQYNGTHFDTWKRNKRSRQHR